MIKKLPLDEARFRAGLHWDAHVARMTKNRELAASLFEEARVSGVERDAFAELVRARGGRLSVAVMTEDWCGDSATNLPLIARLAGSVDGIELRIFIASLHTDLKEAYEAEGIPNIPVVSFFDAGFREIGRWIERPKEATRRIERWESEHPELERLSGSEAPADRAARRALFAELLIEMASWYRGGLWSETLREIREVIAGAPLSAAR